MTSRLPDETSDEGLDDPMLRIWAAAPVVSLGDAPLPPDTMVAHSYRLHRKIGAGAMGVVYEATDLVLERRVAVKVHEIGRSDRAARMWREARALARVADPNVVAVHEVGVDGTRGFIAMELVDGMSARAWSKAERRHWQVVVDVYRQAGRGLAAAHRAGIVHRDFKPDNVLVGTDGRVRVADFGLALEPSSSIETTLVDGVEISTATRAGARAGTPAYMAPEQRDGATADTRSDQYAFFVALYEALHGARPGEPPLPEPHGATGTTPSWIDAVISKGLSLDPRDRHADMDAVVVALDPAPRKHRRGLLLGVIAALASGGLLLRAGGWLAAPVETAVPCATAGAAIEQTWSTTRGAALDRTLADAPAALAHDAGGTVIPGLDAWAGRWRDAARDACASTFVHGQQSAVRLDARNDCLERARQRVEATISLYERADVDAMVRAPEVMAQLPDVSMCSRNDAGVATDTIPEGRAQVHAQLRTLLDRAAADVVAGRTSIAKKALDDLIPSLGDEGFTLALAEALRLRGEVLQEMGLRREAIVDLSQAVMLGHQTHDRDALANSMASLASSLGRAGSNREEALRLIASADAIARDLGWGPERRFRLRVREFEIAFLAERYDEVEVQGAALLADPAVDDVARVRIMSLLATSLDRQARFEEAKPAHAEVLALVERVRGPDHPSTAMVLANQAVMRSSTSEDDSALIALRRALAIRIAAYGPEAPITGELHRQLGDAEFNRGHHDVAVVEYERAIAIARAANDDTGLFYALANRARVYDDDNRFEDAALLLDESIAIAERYYGPNSLELARALVNRGVARFHAGDYATGALQTERAIAILVAELPPDDAGLATARTVLSRFYAGLGRADEAIALFDEAMRVTESKFPNDLPRRAALSYNRATTLDLVGRSEEALAQWRAMGALVERTLAEDNPLRAELLVDFGERLILAKETKQARAVLERARDLDSRHGNGERAARIAELLARARG